MVFYFTVEFSKKTKSNQKCKKLKKNKIPKLKILKKTIENFEKKIENFEKKLKNFEKKIARLGNFNRFWNLHRNIFKFPRNGRKSK